mmetsp:Transcript_17425/g.25955  ORF Transcript_17425/g.25955 Transcript_17425/m.25955 type:complete len:93 (+) Transcript_17425:144-422(+)
MEEYDKMESKYHLLAKKSPQTCIHRKVRTKKYLNSLLFDERTSKREYTSILVFPLMPRFRREIHGPIHQPVKYMLTSSNRGHDNISDDSSIR